MTGATRLEFNWPDPCRRVMMSFLDEGRKGWPSKIYTLDPGVPWLVLVRSASLEAQRLRGLDQTSWLEVLPDRVVSGLECGIRAVWQGGFSCRYAEALLDHNDCTNDLFLAACPILSLDQNDGVLRDSFNSPEHMSLTWESLRGCSDLPDEGREDQGCEVVPVQSQDAGCAVHRIISALDNYLHRDAGPLV